MGEGKETKRKGGRAREKWILKRARRKDKTKNIENKREREREKGESVSEDSWTP